MEQRNPSLLRALLLLVLTIGPLQAQTVFACAMMETVVHGNCCCDAHSTDDVAPAEDGCSCCELSIELSVNVDARPDAPIVKQTEVNSDPDPPQFLVSLPASSSSHPRKIRGVFRRLAITSQSGSDTWLLTQRLRL